MVGAARQWELCSADDAGGTGATAADTGCSRVGYPSDEASACRLLASYDYARAARDALQFAALSSRFTQDLRRYAGYGVHYLAAALRRPGHRDHLMGSPGWPTAASPASCAKVGQVL
jgi:hypothetical protein